MTETLRDPARRMPPSPRPGRRAKPHRASGLLGTLGVTAMGAALPGSGFVYVGRRFLGMLVLIPTVLCLLVGGWYALTHVDALIRLAVDPERLQVASVIMLGILVVWIGVVVATYLMVRPLQQPRWKRFVATCFVVLLCLVGSVPMVLGARYSNVQADLVTSVFDDGVSATRPEGVTKADPWADHKRVNVLLLGGDGGVDRVGVRTDSMIVASMDVDSGQTVLFSLPRNLMYAPFPEGSELHDLYPDGFRGEGDDGEWMLNAVYRNVPAMHPGVLGESDNEGADALKLATSGVLGMRVDYYLLVNLKGFQQIVDAIGGVTVNINQPIPIGGNTDLGIPPDGYLEPGPNRRLNGFEALWFARGRYGLDDYNRMERQRCMIEAIVDEADPVNLLRRYEALAEAGKKLIRTDIPSKLLPAFVDLTLEVQDSPLRSVVFRSSDQFYPGDPDFDWVHATVDKALRPPEPAGTHAGGKPPGGGDGGGGAVASPRPDAAVKAAGSCAYHPVD
jgi:LCP family protein required for cell wall assembly